MAEHANFPKGRLVEIKLRRCLLVLSEAELIGLLTKNPELWQEAIGRGKAFLRNRQAKLREKQPELNSPD